MKKIILAVASALAIIGGSACSGNGGSSAKADSFNDSISIAFGKLQGAGYSQMFDNIPAEERARYNKESFLRGFKTAVMADTADRAYVEGLQAGAQMWSNFNMWRDRDVADPNMTAFFDAFKTYFEQDSIDMAVMGELNVKMQDIFDQVTARLKAKQDSINASRYSESDARNKQYLDSVMAADSNVKVTASGLGYKVVKQGTGDLPTPDSKVNVIYTGRLIDGTVFDSSDGQPVEFPLNQVVKGFAEGLQMMNPGSVYTLYIPASLGYGYNDHGPIPAGSMLVFDVEVPAN